MRKSTKLPFKANKGKQCISNLSKDIKLLKILALSLIVVRRNYDLGGGQQTWVRVLPTQK